ncbi:MAG TPA: class I SAM-dependent methyltransferase [Sporichthyaceae bacterium]|nr:class I SAM-dependent methyltransferase [Sporichthyaceae bacterium]
MGESKLGKYLGTMVGYMTGTGVCYGVWLGDELGLYRAMSGAGPMTPAEVAAAAETNPRLTAEWLRQQAAAGLIEFDPDADTFTLSEAGTMALADDTSPVFMARGMTAMASFWMDMDKVAAAMRGDGAVAWGDHHPHLFTGTEWFFRAAYRGKLTSEWIPALDGVVDKLSAGAAVADIGCGHGASAVVLAQAYPNSRIHGFDFHAESIQTAGKRAAEAGVQDRVNFEVAGAKDYPGRFDLICFFDCLHDMGDPLGIARHAHTRLAEGGSILLVEPFALDGPRNVSENPMAAMMYTASLAVCTPNSLSQEVGLGLGAQAGPARLQEIFAAAGFSRFDVVATSHMNMVVQVRV